jgi:cell division septation protein DedD
MAFRLHISTLLLSSLRMTFLAGMTAALLLPSLAQTQPRRDIAVLVSQVQAGAGDEVAKLLPSLKKSHPDKAGVLFLEALMESNAERAVELYQRIADEHGESEWADDALYRLYQYSYAVGAYRTARSYSERIEKEYPKSPFLAREKRVASGGGNSENNTVKAEKIVSAQPTTAEKADAGSFAVQTGAFARKPDAQKMVDALKTKGYTAYVREKPVDRKTVFAVWIGIFPDKAQAQAYARKLKEQQKMDAIVVRR